MNINLPPTTVQEVIELIPEPYDWTQDPDAQPHKNYDPEKQYLTLVLKCHLLPAPDGYQGGWEERSCYTRPIVETWVVEDRDEEELCTSDHRFNFEEFKQGWETYIRLRPALIGGSVMVAQGSYIDKTLYAALEEMAVYMRSKK